MFEDHVRDSCCLFLPGVTFSAALFSPGVKFSFWTWSRGYKTLFMLNSTNHEISNAYLNIEYWQVKKFLL